MKRPYVLFENLTILHGCTRVVFEMLQHKTLFTLPYFDFIDYVIDNSMLAPCVSGLLTIIT